MIATLTAWLAARWVSTRLLASGPLAGALTAGAVAVAVLVALGLGLAWLRGDAVRDTQAVCNALKLEMELSAERLTSGVLRQALAERDAELGRRSRQAADDQGKLVKLEGELAHAREKAAATDGDVMLDANDPWLREWRARGRSNPAGAAPRSR